jgi:O-antigen/teichoic acid export membrane protein
MLKKYLVSASFQLSEKLIRLPMSLYISILVANYLGADDFGVFSYVNALVLSFSAISSLGTDNYLYKELSIQDKPEKIILNGIFMRFISLILISLLLVIISIVGDFTEKEIALIVIFNFSFFFLITNPIEILLQVKGSGKLQSTISLFSFLCSCVFRICCIEYELGLNYIAIGLMLELLIKAFLLIFVLKKIDLKVSLSRISFTYSFKIFKICIPLLLSSLIISLYAKVDILMVNHFLGNAATANYSIAANLSSISSFIPAVIISAIFPYVIKQKQINAELYKTSLEILLFSVFVIAMLIALFVFVFAEDLISVLYSPEFLSAYKPLIILCWSTIFQVFGAYTTYWLVNEGLQKYRLYRVMFGMIINIGLNWYWIPKFGIVGAAYGTFCAQFISSFLCNCLTAKTKPMFIIQCKVLSLFSLLTLHKLHKTK